MLPLAACIFHVGKQLQLSIGWADGDLWGLVRTVAKKVEHRNISSIWTSFHSA
jgi:hypothetical protein